MKELTVAGLKCSQVLALLTDYLDRELDAATAKRIEGHLLGCPNCERFGKSFGRMVVSLQRDSAIPEDIDSELVTRLLTAIDRLSAET
jgi:anti-sigma factor RsiW